MTYVWAVWADDRAASVFFPLRAQYEYEIELCAAWPAYSSACAQLDLFAAGGEAPITVPEPLRALQLQLGRLIAALGTAECRMRSKVSTMAELRALVRFTREHKELPLLEHQLAVAAALEAAAPTAV